MGDRVVSEDSVMLVYCPINMELKKCVMKLLMIVWQH